MIDLKKSLPYLLWSIAQVSYANKTPEPLQLLPNYQKRSPTNPCVEPHLIDPDRSYPKHRACPIIESQIMKMDQGLNGEKMSPRDSRTLIERSFKVLREDLCPALAPMTFSRYLDRLVHLVVQNIRVLSIDRRELVPYLLEEGNLRKTYDLMSRRLNGAQDLFSKRIDRKNIDDLRKVLRRAGVSERDINKSFLSLSFHKKDVLKDLKRIEGYFRQRNGLYHGIKGQMAGAFQRARRMVHADPSSRLAYHKILKIKASLIKTIGDAHMLMPFYEFDTSGQYLPFALKATKMNGVTQYIAVGGVYHDLAGRRHTAQLPIGLGFPILSKINGIAIERYLAYIKKHYLHERATASYTLKKSADYLRNIGYLYQKLSQKPLPAHLSLVFSNRSGKTRIFKLPASSVRINPRRFKGAKPHMTKNGYGYFFLGKMRWQKDFAKVMASMKDAKGLVFDLRGNGGGDRTFIFQVLPYLLPEMPAHYMASIGVCRRAPCELESRFQFPANSCVFNQQQRDFLASAQAKLLRKLKLDLKQYAEPSFQLVASNRAINYFADKAVVVISNYENFSSADALLAALRGLSNVQVIGQPSIGGSAAGVKHNAGIFGVLRIPRMLAIRPDSLMPLEGHGTKPDLEIWPSPEFFYGQQDLELEKAYEVLRQKGP